VETVSDTPRAQVAVDLQLPPRFVVKALLGEGGMGSVVQAYDRMLLRDVAIKILGREVRDDVRVGTRFLREARAAAQLRHPGIVQVHDVDPNGGYIVMEMVRGESLAARIWREKKLPVDQVRKIGAVILDALAAAHAAGIVHRDVKPANVLLGENGEIKLADFGVAYFLDSEVTLPGTRVGTPAYMAPEQLRGKTVDARADVYSAGITLFEAATGERPSDDEPETEPFATFLAATGDRVLARAIRRAIRERPNDRFPDAQAFRAALDSTDMSTEPVRKLRRRTWLFAAIVAAVVAAAVGFYFVQQSSPAAATAHPAASQQRTIALLPFVDKTKNPMLDFAAAGLPNLLGLELHDVGDVKVVGYYQLLGVAGDNAPRDAWVAAAKQLGADVLVTGEITGIGDNVHVAINVDSIDGKRIQSVERDARVEEVPEIVRRTSPLLAKIALGREIASPATKPTTFAAERELQLGIAALDREHLEQAREHLQAAIHHAPDLALAHYYLAITHTWNTPPAEPAHQEIAKALATGKLDAAQRGMLRGVARIAELDYVRGTAILRPLAEQFPKDRDILYALFECLFHGGHPAEAMSVYRRINALAPKFRLALIHLFTFYVSHADDAGMAWALDLNETTGDAYAPIFEPEVMMARRDYAAAIRLLSEQIGKLSHDYGRQLEEVLVQAYVLSDQLDLAIALATRVHDAEPARLQDAMLAFATVRGDRAARRTWFDTAMRDLATRPIGPPRALPGFALSNAQFAAASPDELRAMAKALDDAVVPTYERSLNLQIAQTLFAEALGNHARVEQLAKSPYPEVNQLAAAALARQKGDYKAAIAAMRNSIAATGDARFLITQWWKLASDLRKANDREGLVAACDEVIRPRLFSWAWASTVGDCLAWTGEAEEALGHKDKARAAWTRLTKLRSAAPPTDPLLAAAKTALGRLRK